MRSSLRRHKRKACQSCDFLEVFEKPGDFEPEQICATALVFLHRSDGRDLIPSESAAAEQLTDLI
jgi:hypothetical protein